LVLYRKFIPVNQYVE